MLKSPAQSLDESNFLQSMPLSGIVLSARKSVRSTVCFLKDVKALFGQVHGKVRNVHLASEGYKRLFYLVVYRLCMIRLANANKYGEDEVLITGSQLQRKTRSNDQFAVVNDVIII